MFFSLLAGKPKKIEPEGVSQTLSGLIANTPWTSTDGYAEIFQEQIQLSFFDARIPHHGNELFISIPNRIGKHPLQQNSNNSPRATLYQASNLTSHWAKNGYIEISEIKNNCVLGRINVRVDQRNFVRGTFYSRITRKYQTISKPLHL
jgi:hypothetical protein